MKQKRILLFWLPLFASWLLMSSESPIVSAVINRLPNEVVMLAAQGIAVSLSIFIESPIINLLATGTTMVRDYHSYRLVRRFTIHWLILLTIITILVAFTPLFDLVVVGWLQAPPDVAVWVRPGLQIMTLWSAAIGWRRFLQGVLIRYDRTRYIAYGTAVRIFTTATTAIGLGLWSNWAGALIGPTALMVGVISEALMASWSIRPLLQAELHPDGPQAVGEPLTYAALFWFHLPLVGTSALVFIAQPVIASSLARLSNPTQTLAAWPIVFQLMHMLRSPGMALPEATIALLDEPDSFKALRRFSLTVAAVILAVTTLVAFSPLAHLYLYQIQDTDPTIGPIAEAGLVMFLLLPAVTAVVSWLRGVLIFKRATPIVNVGMALNLSTTLLILWLGVTSQWNGLTTGALALTIALVLECGFLYWQMQQKMQQQLVMRSAASL
ncbi:MAG: hypothetical protein H6668_10000 [Ardenticatenaceae bacterium]|nr:hypothetical protein [Ardenticatenaceae bacterium]